MHFLLLFGIFLSQILNAFPDRDARGNYSENTLHLQSKVNLKLSGISFKSGDDIHVDFSIRNTGNEVLRIFPAEGNFTTYQLVLVDENDEYAKRRDFIPEEQKDRVLSRRNKSVNLVGDAVKEIIIHKGETFTKRFRINDLFELIPGKKYFVSGYFYPNYTEDTKAFIKSENVSHFFIDTRKDGSFYPKFPDSDLGTEGLTPEETIFLFLGAEMKKNWENYFKFISFPEFIMAYDRFSGEYINSDVRMKQALVEDFKKYLTEARSGRLKYYKVLSADKINSSLSKVNVYVEREQERIPSRFEYQYTLRKGEDALNGFWKISGVVVKVKR
ncbi:MAG: hypothetical protein K8R21_01085 [Leptospira sp.]|nr:hypothetical protein [Leptospira sp.]